MWYFVEKLLDFFWLLIFILVLMIFFMLIWLIGFFCMVYIVGWGICFGVYGGGVDDVFVLTGVVILLVVCSLDFYNGVGVLFLVFCGLL